MLSAQSQVDTDTAAITPRKNIFRKVIDYFGDANKPREAKKFDFSFIGGPYYASDTKLGIGLVAAGIYRHNAADTVNPAGQVNIYGDLSITGYYKVGVRGNQQFRDGARELSYDVSFESRPDKFWGIGFDAARQDSNRTSFKRWHVNADISYMFRLSDSFFIGPRVLIDWLIGKDITDDALWRDQSHRTFTDGVGLSVMFDTRDNVFNAYRGFYARLDQVFAPRFLGNRYAFSYTELTVSHYQPLWKGCIMASRLHSRMTYGNTPWGLMSKLGGSYNMRGYWEGRYNDKCSADLTVELRQHVWRRNGIVLWGGIGEVFPSPAKIFSSHILYNFGVGYRWEFKKRVNVRIDYGFGLHQQGLVFSINEAF